MSNSNFERRAMEDRLTVQDFYNKVEQVCAVDIQNLGKAFFAKDKFFAVCKHASTILLQFSLKERLKQAEIELPMEGIEGVQLSSDVLCLFFRGNEDLWVYKQGKMTALRSHFAPITAMCCHLGQVITGSADMTIRTWVQAGGSLAQDPLKHACSGHQGSIIAFLSFGPLLLSTGSDKKLLVWREKKATASRTFLSNVSMISECSESQQIALYEERKQIHIIDSKALLRRGRIEIARVIDCSEMPPLISINEIDESFIELVSKQRLEVAEVNLGKTMASVDLGTNPVLAVKCLRRLTIIALQSKGLFTIKF